MRLDPLRPILLTLPILAACSAMERGISAEPSELLEMEVATVGVDLRTGAPLALLHSDWEQVLPIWIGEVEAQAIARARQGLEPPRPQTHDLFSSVIDALGGTLEEVRVHELRDDTYFGVLRIRIGTEIREVDARPSDGLALAVRTGARITVATPLLEDALEDVEFVSAHGERAIVRVRGITVSTPSSEDRTRLLLPEEAAGVLVMHASAGVPAARSVRRGDLVQEVRGRTIETVLDFLEAVQAGWTSGSLPMVLIRDGEEVRVEVPPPRAPGPVGRSAPVPPLPA
jgi:uncharacterized protein